MDKPHMPSICVLNPTAFSTGYHGRPRERWLTDDIYGKGSTVGFVSRNSVINADSDMKRIMVSVPGSVLSHEWESRKAHKAFPQVSFGGYYQVDRLLVMDDVHKWCHHHLEFEDIRTVWDIHIELTSEVRLSLSESMTGCQCEIDKYGETLCISKDEGDVVFSIENARVLQATLNRIL